VLNAENPNAVAVSVWIAREHLVGEDGDAVHIRQASDEGHLVAQAHEDQTRSDKIGVRILDGVNESWAEMVRKEGSSPHRRMIREVTLTADCRKSRRTYDDQFCRRKIERCGIWTTEREDDGVTNVFVEERERDGSQHDLVMAIHGMSGQDRRSDSSIIVAQEDGDRLVVDLHGEIVVAGPSSYVRIVAQSGQGLWWDHVS
jgi:hypothetical protein